MPQAVFVLFDGSEQTVTVAMHESLMRAAVRANVDGIAGECGGGLTCATCHVYVDAAWLDRVGPTGYAENEMLAFTASERRAQSRLCCQIRMKPELDGVRCHVPEFQY